MLVTVRGGEERAGGVMLKWWWREKGIFIPFLPSLRDNSRKSLFSRFLLTIPGAPSGTSGVSSVVLGWHHND